VIKSGKVARPVVAFAMMGVLGACTPFAKIDGTNPSAVSRIDGSWTVNNAGGTKIEGMDPLAVIVFDTAGGAVSGFDGCNNFKGTYTFEEGRLKAKVAGTRKACTSDTARTISARIGNLFTEGADVVETAMFGARVIMLTNANGDVRMAPTAVLEKEKSRQK
jgi:heat shock protein HslJ